MLSKFWHVAASALLAVLLTACASTANFEKMLGTWVGSSEDQLIRTWGPPANVYVSGETKFVTFARSSVGYIPGSAPTYQTQVVGNIAYTHAVGGSPGYSYTAQCMVTFELVANMVRSWRWEGNACRA